MGKRRAQREGEEQGREGGGLSLLVLALSLSLSSLFSLSLSLTPRPGLASGRRAFASGVGCVFWRGARALGQNGGRMGEEEEEWVSLSLSRFRSSRALVFVVRAR
jgi:hypothetical protein